MAGRLKALTVIPMGGDEEPKKKEEAPEVEEDGLRDSFEEFADAAGIGSDMRDAAFEALKGFVDQCCAKMDY